MRAVQDQQQAAEDGVTMGENDSKYDDGAALGETWPDDEGAEWALECEHCGETVDYLEGAREAKTDSGKLIWLGTCEECAQYCHCGKQCGKEELELNGGVCRECR
jgi:hypothetical protein